MLIKQENTAMASLRLIAWTLKRGVTVYTSADNDGYCRVIQVDPHES